MGMFTLGASPSKRTLFPPAPRMEAEAFSRRMPLSMQGSCWGHPDELVKSDAAGLPRDGGNRTHRIRSELRPFGLPVACRNRHSPIRISFNESGRGMQLCSALSCMVNHSGTSSRGLNRGVVNRSDLPVAVLLIPPVLYSERRVAVRNGTTIVLCTYAPA